MKLKRNTEKIKVKYVKNSDGYIVKPLKMIDEGDFVDLYVSENIDMKAGEFKLIPLGIAMEIPEGYEAHVLPRSSTFKKYGLLMANSCGIIDNSYCGDDDVWMFPAYATRDTHIDFNDRICQFRILENQPKLLFEKVDTLGNNSRGGFGSTGK